MDRDALNQDVARKRRRAATLASQVLDGTVDVLEASIEMHGLRWQVDVDEHDVEFVTFTVVVSETDTLPVGSQRQYWAPEALAQREPELERSRRWAFETVQQACRNIISRLGG